MRNSLPAVGLTLLIAGVATGAFSSRPSNPLRPDEYDAVALIYNSELAALGQRALYPICIELPTGVSVKPLLQYLSKAGYVISDPTICEPAMASAGQHHPKDYPHGLRIFVGEPQRENSGVLSLTVDAGDLTLRPGVHFAALLRKGKYVLKRNASGEWGIVSYAKEYDSIDEPRLDCNSAKSRSQVR
jgi:hypothetical protein